MNPHSVAEGGNERKGIEYRRRF